MRTRFLAAVAVLSALLLAALILAGCSGTSAPKTVAAKPGMTNAAASSTAATGGAMPMKRSTPEKVVSMHTVANNGVQTISIDLSNETYSPNLVIAKAGVPIDITFGKGKGCVKTLVFPTFGINADMTTGPRTFHLPAQAAGSYKWRCGMDMKHGELRVE